MKLRQLKEIIEDFDFFNLIVNQMTLSVSRLDRAETSSFMDFEVVQIKPILVNRRRFGLDILLRKSQ